MTPTPDDWLHLLADRWLPAADTPLDIAHEQMAQAYVEQLRELERLESFPIDEEPEEEHR